jgi:hypothetical protein
LADLIMLTRSDAPADPSQLGFLRLILPEQGPYIATIKSRRSKGFKPSIFVDTIEDLWHIIESRDRDGYETYYACASYKVAANDPDGPPSQKRLGRTKHNAAGAKAFWLDIDVGPGKPYSNEDATFDALAVFCRTLNIPLPIVVSSGSGLHAYWPVDQTLIRAIWERYANGLKSLCDRHGLHADPARTADISSVLRTPGTHNHKYSPPRKVECDPEFLLKVQPYALEQFRAFLDNAPENRTAGRLPSVQELFGPIPDTLLSRSPTRRRLLEDAAHGLSDYAPCYTAEIIQRCGQMRAFQDAKGCLPEPQWYANLGGLAFCEDGDQIAHEISKGDPRYSFEETQNKLDRQRGFGPTTCKHFHELNPKICEACPHWGKITSPIALGRSPIPQAKGETSAELTGATPPRWEWTKGGALKPNSYVNAAIALKQLGVRCRHDTFHNKKMVEGDVAENLGPELSDPACRAIRELIIARFDFDPGIQNVQQAAERACEAKRFDPVCDYLDAQRWDGRPRLDRWLITYLGAEDTPLNRSIGRKVLVAAVRRVRQPGCKFDYVMVLEGKQGTGKSTTLRILAGDDNFSDQPILHLETRAQQEALEGVWIFEISELVGLRRTEIETVKSFLSKTSDDARPAYGRFRTDQRRRCIFVGTTNDNEYLRDNTGNRRFWPVRTGRIDLIALKQDRDQLWAEAAAMEKGGEELTIPEGLYGTAADQQEQRLMRDPWEDLLAGVRGKDVNVDGTSFEERISSKDLLGLGHLGLHADRITDVVTKRLAAVMRRLGWQGPKKMKFETEVWDHPAGKQEKKSIALQGYWRPVQPGVGKSP